jgi:hypothetical protein
MSADTWLGCSALLSAAQPGCTGSLPLSIEHCPPQTPRLAGCSTKLIGIFGAKTLNTHIASFSAVFLAAVSELSAAFSLCAKMAR